MQQDDFYQQLSSLGHQSGLSSNFATEYKLKIEDLSPSVTEEQLRDIFSPHGRVIRVTIFEDRKWLKGLNYALVSFQYQADLGKAIKLCDGLYVAGSKIKVSAARAETNPNTAKNSPHFVREPFPLNLPSPSVPRYVADQPRGAEIQYNVQYTSSFRSYSTYQAPHDLPRSKEGSIFQSSVFSAVNQGSSRDPDIYGECISYGEGERLGASRDTVEFPSAVRASQAYLQGSPISSLGIQAPHSVVPSIATIRNGGADGIFPAPLTTVNEEVSVDSQKMSLSSSPFSLALTSLRKRFLAYTSKPHSPRGSSSKHPPIDQKDDVGTSQQLLPLLREEVTLKVERTSKFSVTSQDLPKTDASIKEPRTVLDLVLPSPISNAQVGGHANMLSSASSFSQETSELSEGGRIFSPSSGGSTYSMPNKQEAPEVGAQQTLNVLQPPNRRLPPLYTEEVADLTGQVLKMSETPSFEGIYSFVYPGAYYGLSVAIKVLRAVSSVGAMRRKLRREMQTWWALNGHPYILPLFGFHEDFGAFGAMISPWYTNGNSSDYLRRKWVSPAKRVELVASVVAYLHAYDPQIVHGDLKPTNILIDDDGNARVCDFGLARLIAEYGDTGLTTTTAYTGTARYLAYELVDSDETKLPSPASDVHALACVGYAFLYLDVPYATRQGHQLTYIIRDIMKGVRPAKRPEGSTEPTISLLWDLLEACWSLEPAERPQASAVVDFLTQYRDELAAALTIPW